MHKEIDARWFHIIQNLQIIFTNVHFDIALGFRDKLFSCSYARLLETKQIDKFIMIEITSILEACDKLEILNLAFCFWHLA